MTTSKKLKAYDAAQKFADSEDWKQATLCMLVATEDNAKPVRAVDLARKFSEAGIRVSPETIYKSLEALSNDGLLGIYESNAA